MSTDSRTTSTSSDRREIKPRRQRARPWFPANTTGALIALTCATVLTNITSSGPLRADEPSVADITAEDEAFFEAKIRPLLVARCLECHSGETAEASLRLDTAAGVRAGGEQGPVLDQDDPLASRLLLAVRRDDTVAAMPPDEPLSNDEIELLSEWVARGAPDPRTDSDRRIGGLSVDEARQWWSFQPLELSATPDLSRITHRDSISTRVDAYLAPTTEAIGLSPAGPADRRTLLRRLSYDLTGLPPTESEVRQFDDDQRPDAIARQVDRLLASAAHGERWGRHWLDLVRYADTAGENSDHPLPHAWRYRNWVIDSWNQDASVDDFIRWQIAGDLIATERTEPLDETERGGPIVATGYLAIARRFGHDSNKDMHPTYEDTIDTLGKSLLGLTLGCARCHAHKYDPVSSSDYYALYGVFASTKFSFAGCEAIQQPSDAVPIVDEAVWADRHASLQEQHASVSAELTAARSDIDRVAQAMMAASKGEPLIKGAIDQASETQWAYRDDNGTPTPITVRAGDALLFTLGPKGNHGADTTRVAWTIRAADGQATWDATTDLIDDFLAGNPNSQDDGSLWVLLDGRTYLPLADSVRDLDGQSGLHVWRQGELPSIFVTSGPNPVPVWTTLAPRTLFMHPASDGPVAFAWIAPRDLQVTMSGTVADAHGEGGDGVDFRIDHVPGESLDLAAALQANAARVRELEQQLATLTAQLPSRPVAFAVQEGMPHDEAIQIKGEPEHLGDVVPRRWLEVLGHDELGDELSSGRRVLAERLVPSHSPLASRVFVNRLWAHLFGRGIVRTLNDFGTRGDLPTHPALLDRLAEDLVASQSSKLVMRRIVLSDAYQRASLQSLEPTMNASHDPVGSSAQPRLVSVSDVHESGAARSGGEVNSIAEYRERDPQLTSYAYFERRRLSAEELRDSLLLAAGELDWRAGAEHPFPAQESWSFTQHQPFADLYPHQKRSVYLMVKRNRRDPFLSLFDGADPSATTPRRQVTTVPTQALYFFNDPFFHERAAATAELARAVANRDDRLFVNEVTRRAWQRDATSREQELFAALRERWPAEGIERERAADQAIARVILASSQFLYLE